jgi:Protein of unknown function (DUF2971)
VNSDTLLYHYTNLGAFTNIVATGKLWATHIQYLNDTSEQRLVRRSMLVRIEERLQFELGQVHQRLLFWRQKLLSWTDWGDDEGTTYYVICFSEDGGDRLSQWRGYGSQGGVSVGFRKSALEELCRRRSEEGISCSFHTVEYINPATDPVGNGVIDAFLDLEPPNPDDSLEQFELAARNTISFFSAHHKHQAFEEERESRIVMNGRHQVREHRVQGSLVVPYIELEVGSGFPMLVKEVNIGPTANKELTGRAVKNMLLKRGWGSVAVYCSQIPYRGW